MVFAVKVWQPWVDNIKTVLYTPAMIHSKVQELGAQITRGAYSVGLFQSLTFLPIISLLFHLPDYQGKEVLCVGLLSGAFIFMADLMRQIALPYEVDFMTVSSYGAGTVSSGSVKIKKDLSIDPTGKHVIIVEDLIDTGNTLSFIAKYLKAKGAASVALCCLLNKEARRTVPGI